MDLKQWIFKTGDCLIEVAFKIGLTVFWKWYLSLRYKTKTNKQKKTTTKKNKNKNTKKHTQKKTNKQTKKKKKKKNNKKNKKQKKTKKTKKQLLQTSLKWLESTSILSDSYYNGNSFCYLMFAFLKHHDPFQKGVYSKTKDFSSFKNKSNFRRDENLFDRVTTSLCVTVLINLGSYYKFVFVTVWQLTKY